MKERPILFSAPMVRAILDGNKTQTRRVVKPQPSLSPDLAPLANEARQAGFVDVACPYGVPGDRLWVRETWGLHGRGDYTWWCRDSIKGRTADDLALSYELAYAADATSEYDHWRPSIHMPRWASRITLEVTSVRVERLHAITEGDAWFEGVEMQGQRWRNYAPPERESSGIGTAPTARESFFSLWEAINGTESLAANPWVWVVGFKRVEVSGG